MDYYRRVLIEYEKQVFTNLKRPFGFFEKTRYALSNTHNTVNDMYSFVTTIHSEEEVIQMLKEKIVLSSQVRSYRIFKIKEGKREVIFSGKG